MFIRFIALLIRPFLWLLNLLIPVGDLIARVWVAQIFLLDGWYKFENWHSSGETFTGIMVIIAEIFLPILLILGLGGRIIILLFLIFNIFTMYSSNFIWTPEGAATINQQIAWGMLLMMLMLHGSGKISVDHWLHLRHGHLLKLKSRK